LFFLWQFTHLYTAFPGKNFAWRYEAIGKKQRVWAKLTVPQLSYVLKTAPLAGLPPPLRFGAP
jgi:hypothetical protein